MFRRDYRFKASLKSSDYRHIKYRHFTDEDWSQKKSEIYIGKEEVFSQQIIMNALNGNTLYSITNDNVISYRGLTKRIRIAIDGEPEIADNLKLGFMQYVENDLRTVVAEPISEADSIESEDGITQALIIEGKVPETYKDNESRVKIKFFLQEEYEDEKLVEELEILLNISDFVFKNPRKSDAFLLDLWQHPSSWARYYEVPLWSNDHFTIIENMLEELATLGNKVITAIVSDFPWSGQRCYEQTVNPSNLFEYNMVRVQKNEEGSYLYDYSALDRYIETAISVGIDKEIDIFGLSGVWETEMGTPLEDCPEIIRVNYLDKKTGALKYMKTNEEIKHYIKSLIDHLDEKGWMNIVKIMSDHPSSDRVFEEKMKFIKDAASPHKLGFKSAIFLKDIVDTHSEKLDELSICSAALLKLDKEGKMHDIKKEINSRDGSVTWYVCWFPERPNNFIESPLLDNRLIGWFTYLFDMDGFLRWDYALWTEDPWQDVRYKYPYWKCGDMFFVYPGKNMKPQRSLRWENLRYGIQDFQMFKELENLGYTREEILDRFIHPLLGEIKDYEVHHSRSVSIRFNEIQKEYMKVKKEILEILGSDKKWTRAGKLDHVAVNQNIQKELNL